MSCFPPHRARGRGRPSRAGGVRGEGPALRPPPAVLQVEEEDSEQENRQGGAGGQEDRQEEEVVNGFLHNMANFLDQQGLQGPAVAAAPVQQGGQGDQPDDREDQQGEVYVVAGREPGPVAVGDGWEAIDRIGAEAAFRVCSRWWRTTTAATAARRPSPAPWTPPRDSTGAAGRSSSGAFWTDSYLR